MSQLHDLLEDVRDRETFLAFVHALAAERESAQELERDDPTRYCLGGAHEWQNGDIPSFLYAACEYFADRPLSPPETDPSWRMFADFLWCGKIIEYDVPFPCCGLTNLQEWNDEWRFTGRTTWFLR